MMNERELNRLDIFQLHHAYNERTISPVEVINHIYSKIEKHAHLNAYITISKETALEQAKEAEQLFFLGNNNQILLGIPIGLKDLIHTKGIKTTMGSGVYKDFIPTKDAAVVTTLKNNGVVIVGKQNTHELAYGTTGDDSYFGPTRNPFNLRKIAGGSSSGSAAATAAGLCWGSIGTDTSGSIRIPAALCGVVGMKPTYGKVNGEGVHPLSWSMDHVGPITRTVKDNAILFDAFLRSNEKDSIANRLEPVSLQGKTIGVPTNYYFDNLDAEVENKIISAVELMKELGAKIVEVDVGVPEMKDAMEISSAIDRSEAYLINRDIVHDTSNLLGKETRNRIAQGANYKAYEYLLALELKKKLTLTYKKAFEKVDAIVTPTTPISAPDLWCETTMINGQAYQIRGTLMAFTFVSNYIGIPSMSLPCGLTGEGLPVGLQLLGNWDAEETLYKIAYSIEKEMALKEG